MYFNHLVKLLVGLLLGFPHSKKELTGSRDFGSPSFDAAVPTAAQAPMMLAASMAIYHRMSHFCYISRYRQQKRRMMKNVLSQKSALDDLELVAKKIDKCFQDMIH